MNHSTQQRIRVLKLRVRLEVLAARTFDRVCQPAIRGQQNKIRDRLIFALSGVSATEFPAAYSTVQLARHVYTKTSEVMHGRLGLVDLPDGLVSEWEEVVDRLEALVRGVTPERPPE